MKAEHEEQVRGTHMDRRQLVTQIMEGVAIDAQHASQRLGYTLNQQAHHAAVIWSEAAISEIRELEHASQALVDSAGSRHALTIVANAATLWVWTASDQAIDLTTLNSTVSGMPGVRMVLGSGGRGIEGFRRAHLDAITTQRVLGRLRSNARVVSFDMVRLVSLVTQDAAGAQQFVTHTLGELATAPSALRRTLMTFLSTGSSVTQSAALLYMHRNTFLRRLARAQDMLPRPLEDNRVHVAAALEVLNWTSEESR